MKQLIETLKKATLEELRLAVELIPIFVETCHLKALLRETAQATEDVEEVQAEEPQPPEPPKKKAESPPPPSKPKVSDADRAAKLQAKEELEAKVNAIIDEVLGHGNPMGVSEVTSAVARIANERGVELTQQRAKTILNKYDGAHRVERGKVATTKAVKEEGQEASEETPAETLADSKAEPEPPAKDVSLEDIVIAIDSAMAAAEGSMKTGEIISAVKEIVGDVDSQRIKRAIYGYKGLRRVSRGVFEIA